MKAGISFVDLSRYKFDADAYGTIPYRLLEVHKAIPLRRENSTDHFIGKPK